MTTLTQAAPAARNRAAHKVGLWRVVRAEYTKLGSLRSTWFMLALTTLITVGGAGAIGYAYGQRIEDGTDVASVESAVSSAFLGFDITSLIIGVFGVLLMSGEYGTGLIRASLAAVPKRLHLLWAKVIVHVTATGAVMLTLAFASFLTCQALAGEHGASLGDDGVLRAILGCAGAMVGAGLLGLGLGTILRNSALAITVYVALLMVLPPLVFATLSAEMQGKVAKLMPMNAAQAMYAMGESSFPMFSPGVGGLVLAGYAAVLLAAGAVLLKRRDA